MLLVIDDYSSAGGASGACLWKTAEGAPSGVSLMISLAPPAAADVAPAPPGSSSWKFGWGSAAEQCRVPPQLPWKECCRLN
jgi:hypothetical protein